MKVLVISQRPNLWASLEPAFSSHSMQMEIVQSLEEGLAVVRNRPPVLAIIDTLADGLQDRTAHIERLRKELTDMLMVNATVYSAVPTFLDESSFHDALEGLGVLCALPSTPDEASIAGLRNALKTVQVIS